ncbi:MAG: hypothetical protein EPN93_09185 [Spirochaetes bacterium]|nr:MAG: hypothetical protein EPN93_09185 [Spirochaetota bacterium]
MKVNYYVLTVLAAATIGTMSVLSQCSPGNTAFVTIHLGASQHSLQVPESGIFEKIFGMVVSSAHAFSPPTWDPSHTAVKVSITAGGAVIAEIDASPFAESVTIEVPAGAARTITAIAFNGLSRTTGGHVTVDLEPGDDIAVMIQMLPILQLLSPYGSGSLGWAVLPGGLILPIGGYIIYESDTAQGPYTMALTLSITNECISCGVSGKYYRIAALYTGYGEGEMSDPYQMP